MINLHCIWRYSAVFVFLSPEISDLIGDDDLELFEDEEF